MKTQTICRLTVVFVTVTVYTVTCYLHANISWSCQPLALDWIQRKTISDGLVLNYIHNNLLQALLDFVEPLPTLILVSNHNLEGGNCNNRRESYNWHM